MLQTTIRSVNASRAVRGRPSLSESEADAVRSVLRSLRDERYQGNATALARALVVTQSAVSQILSRSNKPSYMIATVVAELLGVDTRDVLRGEVKAPPRSDAYPARATALARLRGLLPEEVEDRVMSTVLVDPDRPMTEAALGVRPANDTSRALPRFRTHQASSYLFC